LQMDDVEASLNFFRLLKKTCGGMMSQLLYRKIFDLAAHIPNGNILEIGTASGASAIAAALGLEASKNIGKVYSFDKHERGSRRHYSSPEASLAVAKKNIASFGMEARVEALIANAEEMNPSFGIGNIEM